MKTPKVALVHDYLVQYGGAEKTLEAIAELFPDAPIYTSAYNPKNMSELINSKTIITAKALNKLFTGIPILSSYLTFLKPLVFENFDLSEYDIIISDSSAYAKGVLTKPNQLHISYIHTPPRFMYGYSVETTKRTAWYYKPFVTIVDHFLRNWDFAAAQRPDFLVANSNEIKGRIKKFYRRNSEVIYPPVELATTKEDPKWNGDYYLIGGRLVAYKNFDKVIKAFNQLIKLNLKVYSTGPEENNLKEIAGPNIEFLGRVSDHKRNELMQNCLGLINSVKDEDFGIVPVEVISYGRPVLAHKSAGHLETVIPGVSGMYFESFEIDDLVNSIKQFHQNIVGKKYNPEEIRETAQKFSKENFKNSFKDFVMEKWNEKGLK